jgi:hypothetical protein
MLAQAGVGKSLLLESLAIHIIHGIDFAGLKTVAGDVVIIDQDTPQNVLSKRLVRLNTPLGAPKHKLYVHSMEGHVLSNKTLYHVVNKYPNATMVIIDSLHSVCGRFNPNYTTDMNTLADFKARCIDNGKTIIFTHHISQKSELTLDYLMTGDTATFAMGNSAIIQQADTYYIIGASAENGLTNRLYIRPVAKREAIPLKSIILKLLQVEGGEKIEYDGIYESDLDNELYIDIMTLFREKGERFVVKEVYESMGHKWGENRVRKALSELVQKNMLHMSRERSNLFKYYLP